MRVWVYFQYYVCFVIGSIKAFTPKSLYSQLFNADEKDQEQDLIKIAMICHNFCLLVQQYDIRSIYLTLAGKQ